MYLRICGFIIQRLVMFKHLLQQRLTQKYCNLMYYDYFQNRSKHLHYLLEDYQNGNTLKKNKTTTKGQ